MRDEDDDLELDVPEPEPGEALELVGGEVPDLLPRGIVCVDEEADDDGVTAGAAEERRRPFEEGGRPEDGGGLGGAPGRTDDGCPSSSGGVPRDGLVALHAMDQEALVAWAEDLAARSMAATDGISGAERSTRLDFKSPAFDPYLALAAAPDLHPPRPKVRPLNTVSAFRTILPVGDPNRVDFDKIDLHRKTEAAIRNAAYAKERAERFKRQADENAAREPVLAAITRRERDRGGPLAVLVRHQYPNPNPNPPRQLCVSPFLPTFAALAE